MSELKRCPFCGGEVRFVKTGCSSRGKIGHLYCDGCKESFFKNDRWHTESELYEKWNTRKPLERQLSVKPNIYGFRYGRIALGGKCPVCGRCVNSKDHIFCHRCGTKLDWEFDVDWRKLFNEQSSISN